MFPSFFSGQNQKIPTIILGPSAIIPYFQWLSFVFFFLIKLYLSIWKAKPFY